MRELSRESAPPVVDRLGAAFRLACGVMGLLSLVAVWIAVDALGWWSVPIGAAALPPGGFFVMLGVLGDG